VPASGDVAESFRADAGRAIAILSCALRDIDRAEDAVQEAYITALERWPANGAPANPGAWIVKTARNHAIDRLRREQRGAHKHELLARLERASTASAPDGEGDAQVVDERLSLIFACCHPSLNLDARVALTLRALGGLTTDEIAAAFLTPPATMAQRLVRAKRKIREAAVPFAVPSGEHLAERVDDVCAVLYLVFNEGYAPSYGDAATRPDLSDEAIRLARLLAALMPEPEILGLLALMLLHHARRASRSDDSGEIVTLEDQDRTRWDGAMIGLGLEALVRASRARRDGPYQLQAAIAAAHSVAPDFRSTNWRGIALLYERLDTLLPSPVVRLNRAAAVAMSGGLEAGLALVEDVARGGELDDYYVLHATRADLLRRLARSDEAIVSYARAIALVNNGAERRFLERRLRAAEDARTSARHS
jgi:RNA polymerase sigma-70 factor (ECF subfamily)